MTNEFHKAIMKRSRLRNKILKDKTETNLKNFKLQRNFYKNLLRTAKNHITIISISKNYR